MNRILVYLPLFVTSILGSLTTHAQELDLDSFRDALDPYVGVWKGEYRIYNQNDELLNQFKVNRNYWWDGNVLQGRVSYDFGEVKQTYFHRMILSEGVPFSFVTNTSNSTEIRSALKGEYVKGTMIWSRVLPKGTLPVRISERIVDGDGGKFIEFWGNQEAKDQKGESLLVRIEGFAAYMPDSREFVVATEEVDDADTVEATDTTVSTEMDSNSREDAEERSRRLQSLGPDRRTSSRKGTPLSSNSDDGISDEHLSSEEDHLKQPEPPELQPNPEIESALQSLNIVGINDKEGEQCIVVDYFLLYEIGDMLDMEISGCVFSGLDQQYLFFEDKKGYQYRLFRKDVIPE